MVDALNKDYQERLFEILVQAKKKELETTTTDFNNLLESTCQMLVNTIRETNKTITTPIPLDSTVDKAMKFIDAKLQQARLRDSLAENLK